VVAPALDNPGGVATVAEFVCETIERSGSFDLTLVSLPSSARDPLGVSIVRPATWFRGVQTAEGTWHGRPFVNVGALGCELEFQRYSPRPALARALADCSLVHVVTGLPAPAHAVFGLGKPVAVFCATRASVERLSRHRTERGPAEIWRRSMTRVIDRIDRTVLERADAIQAMNPWMLAWARELNAGKDKPICLMRPGVDTARFVPAEHGDRHTDPYVLCVGRLNDPRKNAGLLLQAYAAMVARVAAPVRLVLAGYTAPGDAFWREAERLGLRDRIRFIESPDPPALVALYQHASVFALSSDEEGLGMVMLEAMACGIPVVSTSCGGPDSIIRHGVDGCLVPPNDPAAFAASLERVVLDRALNDSMGAEARRLALARFDSHTTGQTLLATYEDLLCGVS
jgi:glycosyltransferase involved in cell wall biosynthesis